MNARAAIYVAGPSQTFYLDTSVASLSITHLPRAGQTALVAGNARVASKFLKYAPWGIPSVGPVAFRPFVMESTGPLHPKADEFIKWVAEQAHPSYGSQADVDGLRAQFTAQMRHRISVALHRGNALILRRWYSVCFKGYVPNA